MFSSLPEPQPQSQSQPPSSPSPPPPSHLTISSAVTLEPLLHLLSTPSISPSVSLVVRETLSRHLRLLHPSDLPLAPIDTSLSSRVSALHSQAVSLSTRLQSARTAAFDSLNSSLTRRVAAACAPPEPTQTPALPSTPTHSALATSAAAHHAAVVSRVQHVRNGADSTRKRAASVREVLRIISDNVDLTADVSQTIADDWTLTFADLPKKRNPAHMEEHPTPERSPVPIARGEGEKRVFLPISPHITPRSKMRKKLLRSTKRGIRQPSFSSPMPR